MSSVVRSVETEQEFFFSHLGQEREIHKEQVKYHFHLGIWTRLMDSQKMESVGLSPSKNEE